MGATASLTPIPIPYFLLFFITSCPCFRSHVSRTWLLHSILIFLTNASHHVSWFTVTDSELVPWHSSLYRAVLKPDWCFSHLGMHQNHLEGLLKKHCWAPRPQFLIQRVWSMAQDPHFYQVPIWWWCWAGTTFGKPLLYTTVSLRSDEPPTVPRDQTADNYSPTTKIWHY